jgi:hypothetical protein
MQAGIVAREYSSALPDYSDPEKQSRGFLSKQQTRKLKTAIGELVIGIAGIIPAWE